MVQPRERLFQVTLDPLSLIRKNGRSIRRRIDDSRIHKRMKIDNNSYKATTIRQLNTQSRAYNCDSKLFSKINLLTQVLSQAPAKATPSPLNQNPVLYDQPVTNDVTAANVDDLNHCFESFFGATQKKLPVP